ncbi:hypothetical protein GQ53DRAFT_63463 [Thozetella sp. PMI_491]|nr:hypothetical protein GQ53DRAFT_63463 [Thozetella sp. PMI_491]
MLQRGHAPRPASSRRSSQSPPKQTSSPPSSQPGLTRRDDGFGHASPELGRYPTADGDERPMPGALRSSGVHDILNPTDLGSPSARSSPSRTRTSLEGQRPRPAMGSRPYGDSGSPFTTHTVPPPPPPQQGAPPPAHFGMPPTPTGPGEPPSVPGRDSPGASHPYPPPLGRRILTPRSPRVTSLSRAATRSVEAPHALPLPPPAPRSTVPPHDISPLGGPPSLPGHPFHGHSHGPGRPPSTGNEPGVTRSLSQPIISQPRPLGQPQESNPLGPPAGDHRWGSMSSMPIGMSGARTIAVAEGQHVLTITPTHGEEIVVPVDMHQASKQADEKRQRNAGASARFRQRKKEREKEQQVGMQRLESLNREVEKRLREVEIERDFYRNERNRYRNLVAQTPGISEYAERAPPSPTRSSRSAESFPADNSPLAGPSATVHHPQHLGHPHPPPFDPLAAERPARRRRTDPEPHFTTPSYGPPTTLPPIPAQPYGVSSSPHPSPHGSAGSARLPPLRFDQPSPSPEYQLPPSTGHSAPSLPPPPVPLSQQPHHSQYPAWSRPPQETGWATEPPRGPPERGPR